MYHNDGKVGKEKTLQTLENNKSRFGLVPKNKVITFGDFQLGSGGRKFPFEILFPWGVKCVARSCGAKPYFPIFSQRFKSEPQSREVWSRLWKEQCFKSAETLIFGLPQKIANLNSQFCFQTKLCVTDSGFDFPSELDAHYKRGIRPRQTLFHCFRPLWAGLVLRRRKHRSIEQNVLLLGAEVSDIVMMVTTCMHCDIMTLWHCVIVTLCLSPGPQVFLSHISHMSRFRLWARREACSLWWWGWWWWRW